MHLLLPWDPLGLEVLDDVRHLLPVLAALLCDLLLKSGGVKCIPMENRTNTTNEGPACFCPLLPSSTTFSAEASWQGCCFHC